VEPVDAEAGLSQPARAKANANVKTMVSDNDVLLLIALPLRDFPLFEFGDNICLPAGAVGPISAIT